MTAKKIPTKDPVKKEPVKRVKKIKYPLTPIPEEIKKIDLEFIKESRFIESVTFDISSKRIKAVFDKIKEIFKKESVKTPKEKYGFSYKEVWDKYCDWFNSKFNKGKK